MPPLCGISTVALRTTARALLFVFALVSAPFGANADSSPGGLHIGGTGTALGGMHVLAKAFTDAHPDEHIVVLPSLGSSGGIKALAAGKVGLSVSSRPLKDAEREAGLRAFEYARSPIVFATRNDTQTDNLTLDDVTAMYAGKTHEWPGGTRLRLVLRPATEGDIKLLRKLSAGMDEAVGDALKREGLHSATNDQDNATALEKIPGSLGVMSLAQIITEDRRIKPLAFNGISGTVETLASGEYSHVRRLFLVVPAEPTPTAKAFIDFVWSPEGQAILASTGHVVIGDGEKPAM